MLLSVLELAKLRVHSQLVLFSQLTQGFRGEWGGGVNRLELSCFFLRAMLDSSPGDRATYLSYSKPTPKA